MGGSNRVSPAVGHPVGKTSDGCPQMAMHAAILLLPALQQDFGIASVELTSLWRYRRV